MRAFVGIDLPPSAKEALGEAVEPLREKLPRARWVRPDLLHLTLAFLGDVAPPEVPRMAERLKEKLEQGDAFLGRMGALGAFPRAGKVRVVWVGLEPVETFERLATAVRNGLREAGVEYDPKPFRSHVTIARCDPPWPARTREDLAETFPSLTELFSGSAFDCDRVTFFSSVLGSSGPTYSKELEIRLGSPSGAARGNEALA
jgi:2'-5' RNA ligase